MEIGQSLLPLLAKHESFTPSSRRSSPAHSDQGVTESFKYLLLQSIAPLHMSHIHTTQKQLTSDRTRDSRR
jgi:hypothetical protein